jgi:hypothetical protein
LPFLSSDQTLSVKAYSSWKQVTGYFDGDGTISISDTSNLPYKLSLSLFFVNQSSEQIQMLRDFLQCRGLKTSGILKTSKGTARMVASTFDGVLATLKAMLPYLFKKSNEAHAAIGCYEGRVEGNELANIFKEEVKAGRRENRGRKVKLDVPYTYPEGDSLMREKRAEKIRAIIARIRASREDHESIREEYFRRGNTVNELKKAYSQYSKETIRRVLGRGRGCVLISGEGIVKSSDEWRLTSLSMDPA